MSTSRFMMAVLGMVAGLGSLLFGAGQIGQNAVPEIVYESVPNFLKLPPNIYLGEVAGVATNSRGNVFVYTRTGDTDLIAGASRTFSRGGSRLFEFDPTGKFVREIGEGVYGFVFAQSVRVDPQDNVWVVDRAASQVLKFAPNGRMAMVMGRKPEAVAGGRGSALGIGFDGAPRGQGAPGAGIGGPPPGAAGRGAAGPPPGAGGRGEGPPPGAPPGAGGRGAAGPPGAGTPGDLFNRPTDVAWDAAGNIFVADGFGNSRIAKFDKSGKFVKSWGSRGSDPGQLNIPHSIAIDTGGNVYVAEVGNKRIQVFTNDGEFKTQITGIGTPTAICISPGPNQYLFSSNSNDVRNLDNGEIYKLDLNGKVLGKFGRAGKLDKEFSLLNEIDCRNPNELLVAEIGNWRVQKLRLK